jgi:hypothetical protein
MLLRNEFSDLGLLWFVRAFEIPWSQAGCVLMGNPLCTRACVHFMMMGGGRPPRSHPTIDTSPVGIRH